MRQEGSLHWGLNLGPSGCKIDALPLSCRGFDAPKYSKPGSECASQRSAILDVIRGEDSEVGQIGGQASQVEDIGDKQLLKIRRFGRLEVNLRRSRDWGRMGLS